MSDVKRFHMTLDFDGTACTFGECRRGLFVTPEGRLGIKGGDSVLWSNGDSAFLVLPEDLVQPVKYVRREA